MHLIKSLNDLGMRITEITQIRFLSSNRSLQGISFMMMMTVCFTSLDASAKYISGELPLWMVLWGRYFFHSLFITFFFLSVAPKKVIFTKSYKLQILRSVLIFCAGVSFWAGLMFLPLMDSMVILFTSPLWVTALAVFLLGEKFSFHRWSVVIIGLLGAILVIGPGSGVVHWAAVLPLSAALFYACVQIATRVLGQRDSIITTLFYTSIVGLILSSILMIFFWESPSPTQWLILIWLGFIAAAGHFFMFKAFERAPVSLLAPFDYMSLIWATLLGFLVFGDLPDKWTILGAVIIVISGLYLVRHETNHNDV